ncbi:MAG TPA: sigma 54-interacting transcriptional regulator [Vicinamibacterales bacterium]|nr:sigma 54-interacting transcriptional regulator [Vicinamibacterales bacterium]
MTPFAGMLGDDPPLPLEGRSAAAAAARAALDRAVSLKTPALITAEAGCRPETIALALHARSRRAEPFVVVHCGAGDAESVERILFGSAGERAAASDLETVSSDAAIIRAAAGTLFLDSIEELPAASQRRLARVLRDAEVRAVDGRALQTRFRLVAATACDLELEAREGRFRGELVKRLASCPIAVPPLRQRSSDVPGIFERLATAATGASVSLTAPALTVLISLPWTRNIDELSELVSRVAPPGGGAIRQEDILGHLPLAGSLNRIGLTASLREARRQFERDYIAAVLERHRWSMRDAARTLGIERANLYRKTRQLGIVRASRDTAAVQR